jgi:hypothetical protein
MKREKSTIETDLMRSAVTGTLPRRELIRRGLRAGLGLAAVTALALTPRAEAEAAVIGPDCLRVCCDGTCDSWKMCWYCPKSGPPSVTLASR